MATIRMRTKSNKKGHPVSLYLRFKCNGSDVEISIPTKVYPEYWSNKTESFKQRILFDEVFTNQEKADIETDLRELKNYVLSQSNELAKKGTIPTKDWLKTVISRHYNITLPKEENFNQYIERFIREIESGQRLYEQNGRSKRYEINTIKAFKTFRTQFYNYQDDKKVKLNFNDITIDLYDEFVRYFTRNNYSANTIGKNVKILKALIRYSRDEGLHNNNEVDRKKFKVIKVQVQNIYLTDREVNELFDLDLSKKPFLELARDVFLIGCYTAQRFSDYSRIRPANIKTMNGIRVIDLIQQKTGERIIIPIKPELEFLLNKYDYQMPKVWEQKVNKYIKEVAKMAGITDPVEVEEIKGGMKIKKTVPKNELVTSHTARRTGCTLMYLAGLRSIDIMKLSGHRTEREFLNYIKVGKEETATSLAKHPYFMGKTLKIAK